MLNNLSQRLQRITLPATALVGLEDYLMALLD